MITHSTKERIGLVVLSERTDLLMQFIYSLY